MAELSPYEAEANHFASLFPCTYAGYEVIKDRSDKVTGYKAYLTSTPDPQQISVLAKAAGEGLTVSVERAVAPRYKAERSLRVLQDHLSALGPADAWIDPDGTTHLELQRSFKGSNSSLDLLGFSTSERAILEDSTLAVSIRVGEDQTKTANLYDSTPERGGQARYVDIGGGFFDKCTSGLQLYLAGSWYGTIAGHCGPVGYGVYSHIGPNQYVSTVNAECGNGPGTCYADVGRYQVQNVYGETYIGNAVRYVSAAGGSGGPPVGLTVCFFGLGHYDATGFGLTCGTVQASDVSKSIGANTILHTLKLNVPSIGGDSGGLVYEPLNPNKARVWGGVFGTNSSSSWHSAAYWIAYGWGAAIVVCGC
jgi:hypothetical protein